MYFVRKLPPAHLTTLPGCFLTFLSSDTWAAPVPGCPCSTASHSEAGEEMQLCSPWSKSSHLWAIKLLLHSLKTRTAELQKHLSYLPFCRFLFFLLPVQNSNHCQRDLKQQIYFSCSACLMSDNIHNTEKFVPKISLLMSFYHNFSYLIPVFGLHRDCHFLVFKAL